jgi:hypothetical protein
MVQHGTKYSVRTLTVRLGAKYLRIIYMIISYQLPIMILASQFI